MRVRSKVLAALAVASGSLLPVVADAQAAPTLTVAPTRVDPGEAFTVTVTCAVAPEVSIVETDVAMVFDGPSGTTQAGTTVIRQTGGLFDATVQATCDGVELEPVVVDVENPQVGTSPPGIDLPPGAAEGALYGTDCPDGTEVTVRVTEWVFGDPPEVSGGFIETLPIDERGDWALEAIAVTAYAVVPPPGTPEGTILRELRFDASCGDVTYPRVTQVIQTATGDEDPVPVEPPTFPTPTPPAPQLPVLPVERPGGAIPATPRPGAPGYTG